jgi:hypothetical protein
MRKIDGRQFTGVSIFSEIEPLIELSLLKINVINDISFFGTSDCHHSCSVSGNANCMISRHLDCDWRILGSIVWNRLIS